MLFVVDPPTTTAFKVTHMAKRSPYSVRDGAKTALSSLVEACQREMPGQILRNLNTVAFTSASGDDSVRFPCPWKEQETVAAIKALEACVASSIADVRFGGSAPRSVFVDMTKIACFMMSSYITTVGGLTKGDPEVKNLLSDTDLNSAQSILYRRLSANLYRTKTSGEYYHIHGSLEASRTLRMIGLEPYRPDLDEYQECIRAIESAVQRYSTSELEKMNKEEGQAGVQALRPEEFRRTSHGRAMAKLPPFTVRAAETCTPPVPFSPPAPDQAAPLQCLQGVRVLELCRIIAGPTIGRSLAAHGADVLKVTAPYLPDVPFFQVDVNAGKHTTALDLRDPEDRRIFESLLDDADVVIDGYRPGSLDRLGYGAGDLAERAKLRGKGYVYVAEDCFGGTGVTDSRTEWASRPGWQQIADCVTGVAWGQGLFMGRDAPVVPPFPISDYGTGALGCVAALTGLHRRATGGGSWVCRTSLVQYDLFLIAQGVYPEDVQAVLRRRHADFCKLRHHDSVDVVGGTALRSMKRLHPELFADELMQGAWSEGYGAEVRWPREATRVEGLSIGYVRPTRPNAFDRPTWEGWERDERILEGGNNVVTVEIEDW